MSTKPKLLAALKLRCPYCQISRLLAPKSWFTFSKGCQKCNYQFERETGYFSGASWMISFPILALTGLFLSAIGKLYWFPQLSTNWLITLVSVIVLALAVAIYPFCMAVWLYLDHKIHPLDSDDDFNRKH